MLAITHLLVVVLFIKIFDLDRNEAFAALLFGVFIDIDHLFAYPEFLSREGTANALNWHAALSDNIQWKSLMHQPLAGIVVAPLSIGYRLMIPLSMWALHLFLDYIQTFYLGVASVWEILFIAVLVFALVRIEYSKFAEKEPHRRPSIPHFIRCEKSKLWSYMAQFRPSFRLQSSDTD